MEKKLVKVGEKYYLVKWSGWNAEVCGIYQSNVYGAESIFAAAPVADNTFFATPTAMNAIVNGEWTPATTITGWDALKPVLTYNGYDNGYASVLPSDYNNNNNPTITKCVPFHFFCTVRCRWREPCSRHFGRCKRASLALPAAF